ncbi:MAG: M15 family metallopeptidase [Gaiellaceae bacterium]
MIRLAVLLLAIQPFHSSAAPLSPQVRAELNGPFWRAACPVSLSNLRVLTVTHWGFDGHVYDGQLIVNRRATAPLAKVFRRLYELRFRIRHLQLDDAYGPKAGRPVDDDISGSFECRQAVPSPCSGGKGTGTWSMHAYGLAVDLNPIENPYVGCGRTSHRTSIPYLNRSRIRPGMVTPAVVKAFASAGWGWGGAWAGNTKDYMHFSSTGH